MGDGLHFGVKPGEQLSATGGSRRLRIAAPTGLLDPRGRGVSS